MKKVMISVAAMGVCFVADAASRQGGDWHVERANPQDYDAESPTKAEKKPNFGGLIFGIGAAVEQVGVKNSYTFGDYLSHVKNMQDESTGHWKGRTTEEKNDTSGRVGGCIQLGYVHSLAQAHRLHIGVIGSALFTTSTPYTVQGANDPGGRLYSLSLANRGIAPDLALQIGVMNCSKTALFYLNVGGAWRRTSEHYIEQLDAHFGEAGYNAAVTAAAGATELHTAAGAHYRTAVGSLMGGAAAHGAMFAAIMGAPQAAWNAFTAVGGAATPAQVQALNAAVTAARAAIAGNGAGPAFLAIFDATVGAAQLLTDTEQAANQAALAVTDNEALFNRRGETIANSRNTMSRITPIVALGVKFPIRDDMILQLELSHRVQSSKEKTFDSYGRTEVTDKGGFTLRLMFCHHIKLRL